MLGCNIKTSALKKFYKETSSLIESFSSSKLEHILRAIVGAADKLSKESARSSEIVGSGIKPQKNITMEDTKESIKLTDS